MKKDRINQLLREYIRNNLSPTRTEQALVSCIYDALKKH